MRTYIKATTCIQHPVAHNCQQHPVQDASSKQKSTQKYNPNHQQTGLPHHSALPIRGKTKKQTNKTTQHKARYSKLTRTIAPNLGGQKPKYRKNSALRPGKRRSQPQ